MKPFDLEAANRGEPIMLENGNPVVFGGHNPDAPYYCRVAICVGDSLQGCTETGIRSTFGWPKVVMAPKKRVVWERRYYSEKFGAISGMFAESENAVCMHMIEDGYRWIGPAFSFEVEE